MKKKILSYLLIVLVLAGILFTSCTNFNGTVTPTLLDSKDTEQAFITDLVVGSEKQEIGNVSVNYDEENIYVTYHITEDGWELLKTNLYIGIEPLSNSSPGQFPFSKEISDSQHLDEYVIPYTEITNFTFGDILYFAAYAEVKKDSDTEGAWGSGIEINPGMNWAMYFSVKIPFDDSYSGVVDIPETTKILDGDTISKITYISDDMSLIEFDHPTPQLNQLNIGDIIVMGVTEYTPEGLLRKVKKVTKAGGKVIIETEFGTLEEAIEDGEFYFDISLQPEDIEESLSRTAGIKPMTNKSLLRDSSYDFNYEIDVLAYDGDGIPETLEDNVTLLGNLSFDYNLIFSAKIADHELKNLTFKNIIEIGEGININVGGSLTVKLLGKSLLKKPIRLKPITFMIGPLPVVLIPIFDLKWSIDGGIYGTLTTEVARTDTFTVGFEWSNGTAQPIADHHTEYDSSLTSSAGFTIKGSVGPELFCKIYGVAGPYCTVGPYIKGTGDKYANPWWELKGGLHVLAGAKLEIFRITYAEVHLTVLDVSKTILQADGPFPNYAPIITSLVADSNTIDINESTAITCFATDPDGDTLTYDWTSPDGGTISGSGSSITWTAPSTAGSYPVNCTVSDWLESVSEQVIILVHSGTGPSNQVYNLTKDTYYNAIQVAINNADNGDNIIVYPGTYYENINYLGKNITLSSTNPNDPSIVDSTIIDGGGNNTVVTFENGETEQAVLSGFTIENGYTAFDWDDWDGYNLPNGGGILITNESSPIITKNTITGNWGYDGGGIYIYNSSPIINGNTIIDNSADYDGGGIYMELSFPDITNNEIIFNTAHDGGGIYMENPGPNYQDRYDITYNIIANNTASQGGGIHMRNCSPYITDNSITDNVASRFGGGGIYVEWSSYPIIARNIITRNISKGWYGANGGGGIYIRASYPTITDNSITDNMSIQDGGGIVVYSNGDIFPDTERPTGWGSSGDSDYYQNIPEDDTEPQEPIYGPAYNIFSGNRHGDPLDYTEGAHVSFHRPIIPPY